MRSPAEAGAAGGARRAAEVALRGVAVGALALALWGRLRPAPAAPGPAAERADARGLEAALARWTAGPVAVVDVRLDTLPDARTRAWLAGLAAAGTRVTWRAARRPALAATTEPVADPAGGARLLVAAPAGLTVSAADALGPLDSARADAAGARGGVAALALPDVGRPARAAAGGAVARAAGAPGVRLGAVLVVGRAGWESRFAAAALEERGWTVRARLGLAPGVTLGASPAAGSAGARPAGDTAPAPPAPPPRLDTATLAAVVALDSSAAPLAPALARYVRAGGGLVLAGDAAAVPALAALAPAAAGAGGGGQRGRHRPPRAPAPRRRAPGVAAGWRGARARGGGAARGRGPGRAARRRRDVAPPHAARRRGGGGAPGVVGAGGRGGGVRARGGRAHPRRRRGGRPRHRLAPGPAGRGPGAARRDGGRAGHPGARGGGAGRRRGERPRTAPPAARRRADPARPRRARDGGRVAAAAGRGLTGLGPDLVSFVIHGTPQPATAPARTFPRLLASPRRRPASAVPARSVAVTRAAPLAAVALLAA
jgi:hypothetical protein